MNAGYQRWPPPEERPAPPPERRTLRESSWVVLAVLALWTALMLGAALWVLIDEGTHLKLSTCLWVLFAVGLVASVWISAAKARWVRLHR